MLPVVDQSAHGVHHSWKLEQGTLKLPLKGNLPYDKEFTEAQTGLVRYVLEQPYSREVLCGMLGLQKQHKQRHAVLEEQLVELLVQAMERAELSGETAASAASAPLAAPAGASAAASAGAIGAAAGASGASAAAAAGGSDAAGGGSGGSGGGGADGADELGVSHWLWHHLSSQIIYFVLFQFASFPALVSLLHERLAERKLRRGRDQLMWVLLQYISGSIQKNPLFEFLPLLRLYDLLYPEREPLAVPDFTRPLSVHQMAAACIWIHIVKKAQTEEEERKKKKNAEKEAAAAAGSSPSAAAAAAGEPPWLSKSVVFALWVHSLAAVG